MSVAKLLLSGMLVASGLILGAFTLHGYFDPLQRQMRAAGARERVSGPWTTTSTPVTVSRAVAQEAAASEPQPVKAGPKPDARPGNREAADAKAAAAKARKRLAEKNRDEKKQQLAAQQPEQAMFQWPWEWFGK